MRILVVGGTGLIGGHAALYLHSQGHKVTIAGRRAPSDVPALAALPFLAGDYLKGGFGLEALSAFDAIVFAAGSDVRHVPQGQDADEHLLHVNGNAVPAFAQLARNAGVKRFVHIGSAYPHIVPPENVAASPYIRSRQLAADGVAALASESFHACSLDPPIVVGTVPGLRTPVFDAYISYARGELPIPPFAPGGGMNFMSTQSLSEAIAGALEGGGGESAVSGKSVLVGDQNMTYKDFMEMFFRAVGNPKTLPVLDDDHPVMPRAFMYAGEKVVSYEVDKATWAALGRYRRGDILRAVEEIVRLHD
ncbi:hypothetical protein C8034_v010040 [Colletotrichum sidae]|uniref:NAD-dependent epimerase/dehydratase domain-containing protein n=1 Tax=Colletotrichum sidae TaxID=1347389 RepID=A0A4R8TH84_9PEZI|nr:hypothetical protein C8034_v010040 [Colletotrichum sidae]